MARYRSDNLLQIILELSKVRITIAVAITTITGYAVARNGYDPGLFLPTLGIFLLACGSSVINHLQEKQTDALMARTRNRPMPREKIQGWQAWIIVLVEILTGSFLLLLGAGITGLLLGWLAMFWYNVVYTGLKRITPHAVIPGSVIGAIPPLVGWVAAERSLIDQESLAMAVFFFTWQVPHFYLLAAKYGHEYEGAGFPALTKKLTIHQIKKAVFFWVVLTALSAAVFSLSRTDGSAWSKITISSFSLLLVMGFVPLLRAGERSFQPGRYFMRINYYVLLVVFVILADPLL